MIRRFSLAVLCTLAAAHVTFAQSELPQFHVPGHEQMITSLESMFQRHHSPRTRCTLWDGWIPMSTLWPAVGEEASAEAMRSFYRNVFLSRQISPDGYVVMDQHRGHAHPGGWPFPLWEQAGGAGWHFTVAADPYREMMRMQPFNAKVINFQGATQIEQDDSFGVRLLTQGEQTSLTLPPRPFDSFVAPFFVIEWSSDRLAEDSQVTLQWRRKEDQQFDKTRSLVVTKDSGMGGQYGAGLKLSVVPVYQHELWNGTIEQLRLSWENEQPQEITIRNMHTATDARHPITGPMFIRGSADYFLWTHDVDFLQKNIERMRTAMAYTLSEFQIATEGAVLVSWPGHDGRTGFVFDAMGKKQLRHGHGVGNNYWDLLPFGHYDCYASMVTYDALQVMSTLEEAIAEHPEWKLPPPTYSAETLQAVAARLKQQAGQRFWDAEKGRFIACVDADGQPHDYGFTFLNLEAIYYGFASESQAKQIMQWIDGDRIVEGDTSKGDDIYRWRFAPRATTRRNTEWYAWVWHNPDAIAWGGQVQDGGAVLGFSFHDLMTRLKVQGPENASERLKAITKWFAEVEAEGGYRKYYAVPGRGSLQGGGTPGGLGLDHEFMESVLVPQVMLYGFLGFQPTAEGFRLNPALPEDWPSIGITRIALADHTFAVTATDTSVEIDFQHLGKKPLVIELPPGDWRVDEGDAELFQQMLKIDPSRPTTRIRVERIKTGG